MKALVDYFNQEKALVGAFSVITNLRICFRWNFLKHYCLPSPPGQLILVSTCGKLRPTLAGRVPAPGKQADCGPVVSVEPSSSITCHGHW